MNLYLAGLRRLVAAALAIAVSGCATIRNGQQLEAGPGVQFDATELAHYRESQDQVLLELVKLTAQPQATNGSLDWDQVIAAGMDYADGKCEAYMHALFRLNRDRRTTTSQISLLGSAAAGLMAAAKSAAKDVAIVAIAFGLASATVDNLSSNLLYELEPSSVRAMVRAMQAKYRDELKTGYPTRPAAMLAIRRYAVICVPANIEAEVNLAVKETVPKAEESDPARGKPPSVTNGATITSDQSFQFDDSSALLRGFVFPNGNLNPANRAELESFMAARGIRISVPTFMRTPEFAAERRLAVRFLKLPR